MNVLVQALNTWQNCGEQMGTPKAKWGFFIIFIFSVVSMKRHKYIYMEFSWYKTIKISNVYEAMRRLTVCIILLETDIMIKNPKKYTFQKFMSDVRTMSKEFTQHSLINVHFWVCFFLFLGFFEFLQKSISNPNYILFFSLNF